MEDKILHFDFEPWLHPFCDSRLLERMTSTISSLAYIQIQTRNVQRRLRLCLWLKDELASVPFSNPHGTFLLSSIQQRSEALPCLGEGIFLHWFGTSTTCIPESSDAWSRALSSEINLHL